MRQKPEDGDELGRERERGMMMETSSPARGVGCATNGTRFPQLRHTTQARFYTV